MCRSSEMPQGRTVVTHLKSLPFSAFAQQHDGHDVIANDSTFNVCVLFDIN